MRSSASMLILLLLALGDRQATSQATSNVPSKAAPVERRIHGEVRLAGQPAPAGVPVALSIVSSKYSSPADGPEIARTVTDVKGQFTFDHLESVGHNGGREYFAVTARSSGYRPAQTAVDLMFTSRAEANLDLARELGPAKTPSAAAPSAANRPLKPEAVQALNRAENLLFREHDPEASIPEFQKAVKIDPWHVQSYLLLGLAYMQVQRWSDAQWAFTEASKVEPENAQAFLGLGSALNEQGDYAGAQKALGKSLDLQPNSAEAHYELARALGALGKWQAAEPQVRRAMAINPDYPGSHALLGNVYLDRQDLPSALKEFRAYLKMAPQGSLAPAVREAITAIEQMTGK